MEGLVAAKIEVDRKVLADLAVTDEATFKAILDKAVSALDQKRAA
jgi:large subunit ribosomal protein L20